MKTTTQTTSARLEFSSDGKISKVHFDASTGEDLICLQKNFNRLLRREELARISETFQIPDELLDTKQRLLQRYKNKPVRRILQVDAWQQDGPDSVFIPDENGIVISAGFQDDLRHTDIPVRIHIISGTPKHAVLLMVRRALAFLSHSDEPIMKDNKSDSDDIYSDNDLPF